MPPYIRKRKDLSHHRRDPPLGQHGKQRRQILAEPSGMPPPHRADRVEGGGVPPLMSDPAPKTSGTTTRMKATHPAGHRHSRSLDRKARRPATPPPWTNTTKKAATAGAHVARKKTGCDSLISPNVAAAISGATT
jgi:hypothetical protein